MRYMKFIKEFERNDNRSEKSKLFNVGDYIVLTKNTEDTKFRDYEVGNIYRIINVDPNDFDFPYEIESDDDSMDVWVRSNQIRIAEPYEIDANKYNL